MHFDPRGKQNPNVWCNNKLPIVTCGTSGTGWNSFLFANLFRVELREFRVELSINRVELREFLVEQLVPASVPPGGTLGLYRAQVPPRWNKESAARFVDGLSQ
jgi:hypothetical protein